MHEPTPWRAMLATAQAIGVTPRAFWRLSLREWRAIASPAQFGLSRERFDALAETFPDKKHERP